jgi:isochorismate synthase
VAADTDFETKDFSNQSIFCLKKPGESNIHIHVLSDTASPVHQGISVVATPFAATQPSYYPVLETLQMRLSDLEQMAINRKTLQTSFERDCIEEAEYISYVSQALNAINDNTFDKVVLAQSQFDSFAANDIMKAFSKTCRTTDSYAYLLKINNSCWLGASPETFIKSDYSTCETVALAGTRMAVNNDSPWGIKEIQEQSIVGSYIVKAFKDLALEEIVLGPQFTKTVGDIQHICNIISARLPKIIDWSELLMSLHPTPALAGYPKAEAIDFINDTESFSRELYGGYLGIMDESNVDLFVNIRCAQLYENGFRVYAGAGINKDSNPQSEWNETVSKLKVMRSILD